MRLKARIKNMALGYHVPAQAVLQNFMLERLLERISLSKYNDWIVLKGGMLIAALVGLDHRTTMDMDATLRGYPLSEETLRAALSEICKIELEDDTTFTLERIDPIRADDEYGGYRAALTARYASIATPLKIDITTGDVITPDAIRYSFQSNFEDKAIEVWAYNLETILAEKVETILRRGALNTRLRDFYDVYIIMKTQRQAFNKEVFTAALTATSQNRMSLAALQDTEKIISTLRTNETMQRRWLVYAKENDYAKDIKFDEIIQALTQIVDLQNRAGK